MKLSIFTLSLLCLGPIALTAQAAGDPQHGFQLATDCMGCHGIPSYSNAYPEYRVPRLGGQHADYIVAALKEYQAGQRKHSTMHAQASTMSEQDMQDLAAYFSTFPAP